MYRLFRGWFGGGIVVVAILLIVMVLSGCSSDPEVAVTSHDAAEVAAVPATEPRDDRWESPTPGDLEDGYSVDSVRIDPDGAPDAGHYAEQNARLPETPATIAEDGSIFAIVHLRGRSVPRAVPTGYVSADQERNSNGPRFECSLDDPEPPQLVTCRVIFQDREYDTGTYYAVFSAEPSAGYENYGTAEIVVPFYTQLRAGEE